MLDPTQRFSSRVENYIKYRPTYPLAVVDLLKQHCQLTPAAVIADVGSGTGILSELFLRNGNPVYGIEPNRDMREAGERLLREYANFHSVAARAEATTLPDHSVDFVTAGQAFHWFDREPTRSEFARILKPGGWVVLVWNERRTDTSPFASAYEQVLHTYALNYAEVDHRRIDVDVLRRFFGGPFEIATFPNEQLFDWDGLKGRLLSSSYAPEAGHPAHEPMLRELRSIFDTHAHNGRVAFAYETNVYYGRLHAERLV